MLTALVLVTYHTSDIIKYNNVSAAFGTLHSYPFRTNIMLLHIPIPSWQQGFLRKCLYPSHYKPISYSMSP